ncbi:MAG TPA: hypothetical protein VG407_12760 [Caulobacteraceae bacterium]|jgi:hypothetical protein|nr:hypothetical protein [Caulobacteraceae bacterium]
MKTAPNFRTKPRPAQPPARVRCRQIGEADLEAVADLLTVGFPARTRDYWTRGLERMRLRAAPADHPRFGYMLECEGRAVGVVLLIFSERADGMRCNISSWYVDEAYRGLAPMLTSAAMKLKHVTYVNTSPAEHTRPILTARDYVRYSDGQFVALPALSGLARDWRVAPFNAQDARHRFIDDEASLLQRHVEDGCTVLIVGTPEGPEPFVMIPRRILYSPVAVMQLVWCRDTQSFVRCAGPLGRALIKRGVGAVILDANGPIEGLMGLYVPGKAPRYFHGPTQPRLNDLAFTEAVVFGA